MATKQFALPLDASSLQSGDITFEKLAQSGATTVFTLTNAGPNGSTVSQLNLITSKGGSQVSHVFTANTAGTTVSVTVNGAQIQKVYEDARGGDWDYVEAVWTAGIVDTPDKSNSLEVQSGRTYNTHGWPPIK